MGSGPDSSSLGTRTSLLSRARNSEDHAAWRELEDRYRELLLRFCRKRGLQHADAEDRVQVVFLNLAKTLPQFAYDPQRGRFRDYLFRCVRNSISAWSKRSIGGPQALDTHVADALAAPFDEQGAGAEAAQWHEEWVAHHYRLALVQVQAAFDVRSVEIFERNLSGESVAELARAYGMNDPAVYALRKRIRARMQELIAEQIREEDQVDAQPVG